MRRTHAACGSALARDAGPARPRRMTAARIGGMAIGIDASWRNPARLVLATLAPGWFPARVPDASAPAFAPAGIAAMGGASA